MNSLKVRTWEYLQNMSLLIFFRKLKIYLQWKENHTFLSGFQEILKRKDNPYTWRREEVSNINVSKINDLRLKIQPLEDSQLKNEDNLEKLSNPYKLEIIDENRH